MPSASRPIWSSSAPSIRCMGAGCATLGSATKYPVGSGWWLEKNWLVLTTNHYCVVPLDMRRGSRGLTFFCREVGDHVFADEPQRVFDFRIGSRSGLEDGHNLVGPNALVVVHHLDALVRGANT